MSRSSVNIYVMCMCFAAQVLGAEEQLNAEQSAQVVVSGEAYFRGLYMDGDVATWNLRDQHSTRSGTDTSLPRNGTLHSADVF